MSKIFEVDSWAKCSKANCIRGQCFTYGVNSDRSIHQKFQSSHQASLGYCKWDGCPGTVNLTCANVCQAQGSNGKAVDHLVAVWEDSASWPWKRKKGWPYEWNIKPWPHSHAFFFLLRGFSARSPSAPFFLLPAFALALHFAVGLALDSSPGGVPRTAFTGFRSVLRFSQTKILTNKGLLPHVCIRPLQSYIGIRRKFRSGLSQLRVFHQSSGRPDIQQNDFWVYVYIKIIGGSSDIFCWMSVTLRQQATLGSGRGSVSIFWIKPWSWVTFLAGNAVGLLYGFYICRIFVGIKP